MASDCANFAFGLVVPSLFAVQQPSRVTSACVHMTWKKIFRLRLNHCGLVSNENDVNIETVVWWLQ